MNTDALILSGTSNSQAGNRIAPRALTDEEITKVGGGAINVVGGAAIGAGAYAITTAITGGFSWRGLAGATVAGGLTCGLSAVGVGAVGSMAGGAFMGGLTTVFLKPI